ncbi:purine-nucleoside phosphorylase [Blattabacterium sp. (Cryptocercus kyebangensis)]|uniref:purine-nucleoside phosphorylase n=1 Tax=Blattabacterium sp. (Cryptocercus kyebangensis) TaxID=298656 RepID=UPI000D7BE22D|nr:purine-nucleoside phosphorylase [Blattabacterium sp. (Cryptocercus kyebangensis)]AWU43780.1 purine-nucleoside phosphorylase [Blattabacterium sp. (Cryptocercus kyebangensis)]
MSITLEEKSTKYIQKKIKEKPDFGIILLENQFNKLVEEIKNPIYISYEEIPNFKKINFYGKFIFGEIENKKVIFSIEPFYENGEIPFSIIIFKNIGVDKLILINISGGVNPNYKMGDVILVKDHINLFPENPKIRKLIEKKNKFFWITELYDQKMLEMAENISMNHNIIIQKGIYVAFPYPNYKTSAEQAMIRSMGGDSVGMNIISYVITARCMNLRVFFLSIMVELCENNESPSDSINFLTPFFYETEKSMPILILIFKEFIKLCS